MYESDKKNSLIILAVTGGIAAYRTCDLVRSLVKQGESVQVLMTENATKFVGTTTFEALTDRPVYSGNWDSGMIHIRMKNMARIFAVVPATANTIGKFASGIADDIVSTTYMVAVGHKIPVMIAPSMNPGMYMSPAVVRNIKTLQSDGVVIQDPSTGAAVCGDEGKGKMASVNDIENAIMNILGRK